ncbi:hypothetical protein HDV64DRAFT_291158 [Trichoderma sp. TUCIM 5745]
MPLQMNHDGRRLWHSVGYGHVDWTDWYLPETIIQRDFITMGPDSQTDRLPLDSKPLPKTMLIDLSASEAAVGNFVQKYSSGFAPEAQPGSSDASIANEVLEANVNPFRSKGITLRADEVSKLKVIETDTSKPNLGLSDGDQVTHTIHNAWPMSAKRPINGFENQFQVLRNLIDLAAAASAARPKGFKVGFQFVSPIATTGHYPLWSGKVSAPEERVQMNPILPSGYSDAKYAYCRLNFQWLLELYQLFLTLTGFFPGVLLTSLPRLYQIFFSQTISTPCPIYIVDNSVEQSWKEMTPRPANAFGVPSDHIIPWSGWLTRVRQSPLPETENPEVRLVGFLEEHFLRM